MICGASASKETDWGDVAAGADGNDNGRGERHDERSAADGEQDARMDCDSVDHSTRRSWDLANIQIC